MSVHRQATIFILSYFLLSACLCTQPTRSRRQKRGIMKMMMHIMWDPVRLIRYYYAYDVTREIAKSWRKILPTIMLLPITQNMPHAYGLAKYVHPTNGFRDSKKKTNSKHYSTSVGSPYKESAGNVKPVAIPPEFLHHILPTRYAYAPQQEHQYYSSSQETEIVPQYKNKKVPPIFVDHAPFGDKENDDHYSVPHYYFSEGNSGEQLSSSSGELYFPRHQEYSSHKDIASPSSQSVPKERLKKRPTFNFPPMTQQSHIHYVPHAGSLTQDESSQESAPILHPGQEFHIVLHPIPVRDFDPHSLQPPSDGRSVQFVPVHPHLNGSHGMQIGPLPLLFRSVAQNGAKSAESHEELTTNTSPHDETNNVTFHLNSSESNIAEDNANSSAEDTKSRVTWIPKKSTNPSRRKDQELTPDGTITRTASVHRNSVKRFKLKKDGFFEASSETQPVGLSRHSINLERLREDLKHGTPVLIPFNKSTYTSDIASHENKDSEIARMPHKNKLTLDSSNEQSGERNSTQKLILFLKKTKVE